MSHPSLWSSSNSEEDIFDQVTHVLPTIGVLSDTSTDRREAMT